MARQPINLGTAPTGEDGDNARQAFERVNQMTAELYGRVDGMESGKVSTSDPRLSDPREWTAATVTQAEAVAGTGTTRLAWTVQRVWQAVAAWWAASAMKTKLDSIAPGATANSTDAQLRDRSTHTGTQAANTISNFASATRGVTLDGINTNTGAISAADTVLSAFGKVLTSESFESIVSHNIVINGSFNINQRGTPLSPTLSAGQFGYDRWKAGGSGCTYTTTYSVGSVTTINIASGSLVQLVGAGYQSPGWYTLSWTGTATARIDNGAYSASPISVYLPATNPVSVEFGPGSVTLVQLCKGNVVTPFKHRLYTEELLACQRFYQNGLVEFCGNVSAGGTYYIRVPFQTEMRVIPTVVLTNAYNNSFPATVGTVSATMRSFTETRVASATATPGAFASSFTASAEL